MNTAVINYFEDYLYIHLIIQGIFFTICLVSGWCLLFNTALQYCKVFGYKKERKSLKKVKQVFHEIFSLISVTLKITNAKKHKKKRFNLKNGLNIISILPVVTITMILVLGFGIMANRLADTVMNAENSYHFGLKPIFIRSTQINEYQFFNAHKCLTYLPGERDYFKKINDLQNASALQKCQNCTCIQFKEFNNYKNSDEFIKLNTFIQIFAKIPQIWPYYNLGLYYDIKHKLLQNPVWASYLSATQTIINYSQVLVFSFLILLYIVLADFILRLFLAIQKRSVLRGLCSVILFTNLVLFVGALYFFQNYKFSVFLFPFFIILNLIIVYCMKLKFSKSKTVLLVFIMLLYAAAGIAWEQNEKEFDSKVFGVFKSTASVSPTAKIISQMDQNRTSVAKENKAQPKD